MSNSPDYQTIMLFVTGTAGILILAGAIVLFVTFYQKKMIRQQLKQQLLESQLQQRILEATLDSQETERKRVASDLHDSIGGMLSVIRLGLSALGKQLPDPTQMDPQKHMLDDAIESVRKMSRELMPATLEKFGLAPAVRELCERIQSTTQIQISMLEMGDGCSMNERRQLMIYRIIQELLHNALKHSQASFIEVILHYKEMMHVIVEDNGIGIHPGDMDESGKKSLSLFNIQSRVRSLGATVLIDPSKKEGRKIVVSVPYETQT